MFAREVDDLHNVIYNGNSLALPIRKWTFFFSPGLKSMKSLKLHWVCGKAWAGEWVGGWVGGWWF